VSLPTPPKATPSQRVAESVLSRVRSEALFCPTIRLENWPGKYPPPFNDTQVRQRTGLFGFQVGGIERSLQSGSLLVHLVVQIPRTKPDLLDEYRDWLQEILIPWGALLFERLPLISYDVVGRVTSGPLHDDEKTFLSQRLVFPASWEILEVR
jgi:hypothetical protein